MKTRRLPDEMGILGILVLVVIVMSLLSENFRTVGNLQILLLNGAVIAFLTLGQTFVLLTGGIDLSTGANVAMTGMLVAILMRSGLIWPIAVLVGLGVGVLLGVLNGVIIHYIGIPPFIVTFATQGIAIGIAQIMTGARSVLVTQQGFGFLGRGSVLGIPMPVLMVFIAALIFAFVLRRTMTGVHIYSVGGNAETSRLAGVNIGKTIILVYAISGLCGAIGGIIYTSRLMVGTPTSGLGDQLFFSIAAAVVGGVSLFGGIGTIPGAFLGAMLIVTVSNGMNVLGVESYWQPLVIGVIILIGVTLDTYRRKMSLKDLFKRFGRQPNEAVAQSL